MKREHQLLLNEIMRKKRQQADTAMEQRIRVRFGTSLPLFGQRNTSPLFDEESDEESNESIVIDSDNSRTSVDACLKPPLASCEKENDFLGLDEAASIGFGHDRQGTDLRDYSMNDLELNGCMQFEPLARSRAGYVDKQEGRSAANWLPTTFPCYSDRTATSATVSWRSSSSSDVNENGVQEATKGDVSVSTSWNDFDHSPRRSGQMTSFQADALAGADGTTSRSTSSISTTEYPHLERSMTNMLR
jgi:hypothetical protein